MGALEDYVDSFAGTDGYLNWAAFGPLSPAARTALIADAERQADGRPAALAAVWAREGEARRGLAGLLGAAEEDISLHSASGPALQHAFAGLSGHVVCSTAEFPSITVALARAAEASRGALVPRWIRPAEAVVTAAAVRDALDDDVTALAVSHVDFRTGHRADLAALREALGPDRLLIVDAVQSFGVVAEDWALADVVVGHGYKWLRAGRGTGFARFAPSARERIAPVLSGFAGTSAAGYFADVIPDPAPTGRAYAVSSPDPLAAGRLAAAVSETAAAGVGAVARRVDERVGAVLDVLDRHRVPIVSPRDPARRAGVVALAPRDPAGLGGVLADAGITATVRDGRVRFGVHAGTGEPTVALLDDALATAAEFISA
ncbi:MULTISPECIES: aminotransferase class V-fold PLP-dependent enzyme [unclassified Microbacterium]|uniref:aminotransferase class V-fold PLP-dependent enzyme n=1 Tax=unclassified Microbacterium TaxID=2609290 RepID=UPI00300F7C74